MATFDFVEGHLKLMGSIYLGVDGSSLDSAITLLTADNLTCLLRKHSLPCEP
ncbi:MAG: hypothetical protein O2909_12925 [Chloroflexi bacterium]|nr:hypothetical protein [Chloroflexota bacterium]MDA1220312.1 hypothetical protein [Chloroflexota bacterium]